MPLVDLRRMVVRRAGLEITGALLLADCKALFVAGNKLTVTFDKGA